jgi:pyroglutamyl-peptidase
MNTVLITGFEPFGGLDFNPSQYITQALDGEIVAGRKIIGLTLPVLFGEDTKLVFPAIEELRPALVLSFGLDVGARSINVEMFAVNHRSSGKEAPLAPIIPSGPAAHFASIDVDNVVSTIVSSTGVPALRHGYAGSYLCNHVFYQTLNYIADHGIEAKVGFIHVPRTDKGDESVPGWSPPSLDDLVQAAKAAIEAILQPG